MLAATVLPAGTNTATQPFRSVGALPYQLMSIFNVILGYTHHSQVPSPLSSTAVHRTSQKRQRRQKPCPAGSPVKPPINLSWFALIPPLSCVLAQCHSGWSVDPESRSCHWPAMREVRKLIVSVLETYSKFDIAVTAKPVAGGLFC